MDFIVDDGWRSQGVAAGEAVAGTVAPRDRASRFDGDAFRALARAGLLGAPLAESFGGAGLGAQAFVRLLGGFGEGSGDAGLSLAWAMQVYGCALPIQRFGSTEQCRRLLPGLVSGERVGAFAHAERQPSIDPVGLRTVAVRRGASWVLKGTKTWVVNGPVADVFLVTAVTDPSRGRDGVSTFLVERDAPGLEIGRLIETVGLRTAAISELVLEGCEVPAGALLGAEGEGLVQVGRLVQRWLRVGLHAPWVGLQRALVNRTIVSVRERLVHGVPASHSQSVRAAIADMRIRSELMQRLVSRAAWHVERGEHDGERDVAVGALYALECASFVTREALRLQAEQGAESDRLAERLFRDAAALHALSNGGTDVLRSVIAGSILNLG